MTRDLERLCTNDSRVSETAGKAELMAPADARSPSREDDVDRQFRREHPWIWWATLFGPPLLSAALLAAIYVQSPTTFHRLLAAALGTFFLLGRFVILLGESGDGPPRVLHAWQLLAMVLYMDLMVAVVLSFHLAFAYRLPYVGSRLRELEAEGRLMLAANPWMRRTTFWGVVAFVMIPLASTGSIGGSIFGRLLGMSRGRTLSGVALGSVLGAGVMYFGSAVLNAFFGDYPIAKYIGGGGILLAFLWVLNRRYRRLRREEHD
ncbi:MAG: hypothetical protein DWQ37_16785 [Planctomycetota bacterium]|nr:MAG: hypothetical protein DWQ37_16785 [Planctomycetota bacterium]